ncbi:hypothetical protein V6N13_148833 [Hibiscus sabdariffa]
MEILCFCALGVCCKPYLLLDLAREFRSACLEDSSKSITERTAQESLHSAKAFSDGSNPAEVVVEDTVVPESVEDISSDQLRRMWDGNVRDDMRVREVVSSPRVWSNDEVVGCIARLETTIPSVVVVQEVVLSENRDA